MSTRAPSPAPSCAPTDSVTAQVRRASHADLDGIVATLVASHVDYVWERWALGPLDDGERAGRLAALYRADVELVALAHGVVWTTEGCTTVAAWVPAGTDHRVGAEARAVIDAVASAAFGDRLAMIDRVDAEVARHRPPSDWHLATMGTRPEHERRGLGTAVLLPMLRELDAAGAVATLETSEPGNLRFYGRVGFEAVAHVEPLHGAPPVWVMRRAPA